MKCLDQEEGTWFDDLGDMMSHGRSAARSNFTISRRAVDRQALKTTKFRRPMRRKPVRGSPFAKNVKGPTGDVS